MVAAIGATDVELTESCPSWLRYNYYAQSCVCGSSLRGIVDCCTAGNGTVSVMVMSCHCMSTFTDKDENSSTFVVG